MPDLAVDHWTGWCKTSDSRLLCSGCNEVYITAL